MKFNLFQWVIFSSLAMSLNPFKTTVLKRDFNLRFSSNCPTFMLSSTCSQCSVSVCGYNSQLIMSSAPANEVQVYGRSGCKYCRIAKAKLDELQIPWTNIDMDAIDDQEEDVVIKSRKKFVEVRTVPQIFVGSDLVGGCDDMITEIELGSFQSRLTRFGIVQGTIAKSESNKQHRLNNSSDMVFERSNKDALNLGPSFNQSIDNCTDAVQISYLIQRSALLLTDKFATCDGARIRYKEMRASPELADYVDLVRRLQFFNSTLLKTTLSDSQRLSFFTNLYNALIIHANCEIGSPSNSPAARSEFFSGSTGARYNIGGLLFSPDDIEHGILRANYAHPSRKNESASYFNASDPRRELSLSALDPRIHFVLNCGAGSCPPISVLGNDPSRALTLAAAAYLGGAICVDIDKRILTLPRLILWYGDDFGADLASQIRRVVGMLSADQAHNIQRKLKILGFDCSSSNFVDYAAELSFTVEYNSYDWTLNDDSVAIA